MPSSIHFIQKIFKSSNNNSLKDRKDKTSISGERYYNLFNVTHIGIINTDEHPSLTRKIMFLQYVLLQIFKKIMLFRDGVNSYEFSMLADS